MSLSDYFINECEKKKKENESLAQSKIADPFWKVNYEISSPLLEKNMSSQGEFSKYVGTLVQDNSDLLSVAALGLTSDADQTSIRNAYNLATNIISAAMLAKSDVLLVLMKKVARNAIKEIKTKREKLDTLTRSINELRDLLLELSGGSGEYERYLAQIKAALALLAEANRDLKSVRGAYARSDRWLSKPFGDAKNNIDLARNLLQPDMSNPSAENSSGDKLTQAKKAVESYANSDFVKKAGFQQALDWGIPKDQKKLIAFRKVPLLARQILIDAQDYTTTTILLNSLLFSFKSGLAEIKKALPAFLRTFNLGLLDKLIARGNSLEDDMSGVLYSSNQDALHPTKVVLLSPKWHAQLSILLTNFGVFSDQGANSVSLNRDAVGVYEQVVSYLKSLNNLSIQGAQLIAKEAEEDPVNFDVQMAVYGLSAIESLIKPSKRHSAAAVGTALTARISLTVARDRDIEAALQKFIDQPLPLESSLELIADQFKSLLDNMGFDKASEALSKGKFSKFFKLNAKEATSVGAGLAAISLLKQCLPSTEDQEKLSDIQTTLERSEDLINFKLAVDFDLAIFKNIQECLKFTKLASFAKIKEALCGNFFEEDKTTLTATGKLLGKIPV